MLQFKPKRNGEDWERLAFSEVLIPDVPNVYGDFHSRESVRAFAYGFMLNGFGLDVNHDGVDRTGSIRVVESFIARDGDPDFIAGAWVVGIYVLDDQIWNDILSGELNGFSYEALVSMLPVLLAVDEPRDVTGETLPSADDGHTHIFYVRMDADGRVIAGGTDMVNGHSHVISSHTYTDEDDAGTHRHRFSVSQPGEVVNE